MEESGFGGRSTKLTPRLPSSTQYVSIEIEIKDLVPVVNDAGQKLFWCDRKLAARYVEQGIAEPRGTKRRLRALIWRAEYVQPIEERRLDERYKPVDDRVYVGSSERKKRYSHNHATPPDECKGRFDDNIEKVWTLVYIDDKDQKVFNAVANDSLLISCTIIGCYDIAHRPKIGQAVPLCCAHKAEMRALGREQFYTAYGIPFTVDGEGRLRIAA